MGAKNLAILGMSDEDFAKLPFPPEDEEEETTDPAAGAAAGEPPPAAEEEEEEVVEDPTVDPAAQENNQVAAEETDPEDPAESTNDPAAGAEAQPEPKIDPAGSQKAPEPKAGEEPQKEPAKAPESEPKTKDEGPDYKGFYEKVMAPFKANGKLIELSSPDEVIQLMQMGANYTKKMQAIQPLKKYLVMLESNGLLDEDKLSFLIDIDKKNPDAIRKLLKDSNIDPIDMDTSAEVNYKGGQHKVTDREVTLHTAIEDLKMLDGGLETLQSVRQWDLASQKILFEQPDILQQIHVQRENGIYAMITNEMERRKTLGYASPGETFLVAYKKIGDELNAKGAFRALAKPAVQAPPPPAGRTPVAKTTGSTPATKAQDNQKVRAAASPRTAPRKATTMGKINPLAMSDEDFLKLADKVR